MITNVPANDAQRDCTTIDKVVEIASKEIGAIRNIEDIAFKDFFRSRIINTNATTTPRYYVKVATKLASVLFYYCAFKAYQASSSIPSPDNGI